MHPLVESRRAQMTALCRRFGVARLDLIGSAAHDDFDAARNDLDFLADLGANPQPCPLDAYFGLKDALQALFNRPVDLISAASLSKPYIAAGIEHVRQPIYIAPEAGTCAAPRPSPLLAETRIVGEIMLPAVPPEDWEALS